MAAVGASCTLCPLFCAWWRAHACQTSGPVGRLLKPILAYAQDEQCWPATAPRG